MNENAINEWNIKIWCLQQWNNIKKKNLLKQNYLFHRNLQFQKLIKIFTICVTRMRYEDQTHMHPGQPLSPTTTQCLGKHHTLHNTLANFNLHQPLISFLYMIPSCKQYWNDVQTWYKVWNHIDAEFNLIDLNNVLL